MSFGGLLASAIGGGAQVIAKQAEGDIEKNRKVDLLKQEADIKEQMQMRLAEAQERIRQSGILAEKTGPIAEATLAYRGKELEQASTAALKARREAIPVAGEEAAATAEVARQQFIKSAQSPEYLKSLSVVKLADPETRAHIAQMSASAGASAQQTKLAAEQLKQLSAVGDLAAKVRGVQDELTKTTDLDKRKELEQRIVDFGFTGRDTAKFLNVAERAMDNGASAMKLLMDPNSDQGTKETAKVQLDRANAFADQAAALAGITLKPPAKKPGPWDNFGPKPAKETTPVANTTNTEAQQPGLLPSTQQPKITSVTAQAGGGGIAEMSNGTRRVLTPEQFNVMQKIQSGEPTTPRERQILSGMY